MGFEPTPPERLEPKSSALDHSATPFFFFALPPSRNRDNTGRGDSSQKPSSAAKESSLLGYGSHKSLPRRLSWQRWDSNPRPEETGALIQHLRPLGHATRWGWFPRAAFHQSFPCRSLPLANALKFSTVEASFLQGYAVLLLEPPLPAECRSFSDQTHLNALIKAFGAVLKMAASCVLAVILKIIFSQNCFHPKLSMSDIGCFHSFRLLIAFRYYFIRLLFPVLK